MPGTKILWGQIIAVFALVLVGIWSATQWTAHALAYQSELGQPWFMVGKWPIYPPPAFFWWWFSFDAYAPEIFQHGAMIAVSGGFAAIIVAVARSTSAQLIAATSLRRCPVNISIRKNGPKGSPIVSLAFHTSASSPSSRAFAAERQSSNRLFLGGMALGNR